MDEKTDLIFDNYQILAKNTSVQWIKSLNITHAVLSDQD